MAGGALLAWGRMAGHSMLEWAILLARFAVRAQRGHAVLSSQAGAVVVPLALRRHRAGGGNAVAAPRRPHARLEAFFSLSGGSGRTTLAVEVAALMASRGAAARASGGRGARVALLVLAARSPSVALRLGLPLLAPPAAGDHRPGATPALVTHASGLAVHTGGAVLPPSEAAAAAALSAPVDAAEHGGADLILADIDCDLTPLCVAVLRRCDRVHVTLTASATGVLDAYRSTAALRRLGLRDRLDYVVNRCAGPIQLGEVMSDLDGAVVVEVPQSAAFVTAENHHRPAAFDDRGPAAAAIARLAEHVERELDAAVNAVPRWGTHAG